MKSEEDKMSQQQEKINLTNNYQRKINVSSFFIVFFFYSSIRNYNLPEFTTSKGFLVIEDGGRIKKRCKERSIEVFKSVESYLYKQRQGIILFSSSWMNNNGKWGRREKTARVRMSASSRQHTIAIR